MLEMGIRRSRDAPGTRSWCCVSVSILCTILSTVVQLYYSRSRIDTVLFVVLVLSISIGTYHSASEALLLCGFVLSDLYLHNFEHLEYVKKRSVLERLLVEGKPLYKTGNRNRGQYN